jgi:hypothetical protein
VVALGLERPAAQPAGARDDEAVGGRLDVRAEPAQPSTTAVIRSDSLSRSSCAPRTTVSPSAKQPSSATSGSSSMASGTSSASTTVPTSGPAVTSSSVIGSEVGMSSPVGASRSPTTMPPIRPTIRKKPVRVQFTPTFARPAASRARAGRRRP